MVEVLYFDVNQFVWVDETGCDEPPSVLACKFMKGTVNGKRFLDFLQGTLISEMLPFDGENPLSIIVLDYCSL